MPSHCRTVETQIWGDERFFPLEPDSKLVFFYLITNELADWSGLYRLSLALAEESIGLTRDRIKSAMDALCKHDLIMFDHATSVVWVVNMWRKQVRSTPNERQTTGVLRHLEMLPYCSILEDFFEHYQSLGYFKNTPAEGVPKGSPRRIYTLDKGLRREKREERRLRREKTEKSARTAKRKKPSGCTGISPASAEQTAQVCEWIARARRYCGITSKGLPVTYANQCYVARPMQTLGASIDDWQRVIERSANQHKAKGDIESTRMYLTLSTLSRDANFSRMLERDDLD